MFRGLAVFLMLCAVGIGCVDSPKLPNGSEKWTCQLDEECKKLDASAYCERGLCVLWGRNENATLEKVNETSAEIPSDTVEESRETPTEGEVEKTVEGTTENAPENVVEESTSAEAGEPNAESAEPAQEADAAAEQPPSEQEIEEAEPEDPCRVGEKFCGGQCVNVQTSQTHCGQCNNACGGGLACTAGLCACPKQEVFCGTLCVDLQTNAKHCGRCGVVCGAGDVCEAGVCLIACEKQQTRCGAGCVDIQTDPKHCGQCAKSCPAGQVCTKGACGCPTGTELCNGICVNKQQDPKHCGACGKACSMTTVCQNGACVASCGAPLTVCGTVCVDLQTDAKHCGTCDKACATGGTCQIGACSCPSGTQLCGSACVNTLANNAHCGKCAQACPVDARCTNGQCSCPMSGHRACGTPLACVDTRSDPRYCAGCFGKCLSGDVCRNSVCVGGPYTETISGGAHTTYTPFAYPTGIVKYPGGGFLVVDPTKNQILQIYPSGSVGVFAGTGARGSADGAAASATFWGPQGLTWGPNGELYVADTFNHRIRKISAQRQVTTFAGTAYGDKGGTTQTAQFGHPVDIVFDSKLSVFYIADRANYKIRKIDDRLIVTTLAGSTYGYKNDTTSGAGAQFSLMSSLTLDDKGDLYVSDTGNHRIRKVLSSSGATSTVAGNGTASSSDGSGVYAGIASPLGILWEGGMLYVAEYSKIRRIDIANNFHVTTFVGQDAHGFMDGLPSVALFAGVAYFAFVQEGGYKNLYVTEIANRAIRRVFFQ
ncbi:hypothetical protein L6R29_05510 [Myxococcota bacterium]|nr:hypothetical protein [Myxococcota bacterium]